jgi:hypothetical protein
VIGLGVCPRSGECPLRPTWLRIQDELEEGLAAQTVGEIAANICEITEQTETGSDE